ELRNKLGDELLQPHTCYYPLMKPLLERSWLSAAAHITGGGLTENLPRALPPRTAAEIHLDAWRVPPLFRLLERLGRLPPEEMLRTFNMGIGMVLVVPARHAVKVMRFLRRRHAACFEIGRVARGRAAVHYRGSWR
ncbi:MAG: AIR synthase-related protein, partial [Terriglobia bacterium]